MMENKTSYRIESIIEDIKLTDNLLVQFAALDDEVSAIETKQYQRKKSKLVKELLLEMLTSGVSLSQFENLYQNIFTYLKVSEQQPLLPVEQEVVLRKVEPLVVMSNG